MKTQPRSNFLTGFTLIEMLVTITIIVILAGLSLGGFKYVSTKQANSQAQIQIKLLENGIEEYKLDNGVYPPVNGGTSTSNNLFRALYWDGAKPSAAGGKIYVPQLDPENNKQGWIEGTGENAKIVDPWGNEYIYRLGSDANAINPDFDLLSTGQDGATDVGGPKSKDDHSNF